MATNTISDADRKKLFGEFSWKRTHGDFIDTDDRWVRENIVSIYVPQLKGVPSDGGRSNGHIQWHKAAVPQMLHAWGEVEALGLLGDVKYWGGSYVSRVKRGGSTPSNHAYGSAFDINVRWNWLGDEPATPGQFGSVSRLVPVFKTHGFGWGGDWTKPKDGMHFEVLRIVNYDGPEDDEDDAPTPAKRGPLLVINDEWQNAIPIELKSGSSYVSAKALTEATGGKWEGADVVLPAGQTLMTLGYKFNFDNATKKLYAYGEPTGALTQQKVEKG